MHRPVRLDRATATTDASSSGRSMFTPSRPASSAACSAAPVSPTPDSAARSYSRTSTAGLFERSNTAPIPNRCRSHGSGSRSAATSQSSASTPPCSSPGSRHRSSTTSWSRHGVRRLLPEREGVTRDAWREAQGQQVAPGLRQVHEAVEALLVHDPPTGLNVLTGIGGVNRLAVEENPHMGGPAGRAHDEEDPPRLEAELQAGSACRRCPVVADPPATSVGELVIRELTRGRPEVVRAGADGSVDEALRASRAQVGLRRGFVRIGGLRVGAGLTAEARMPRLRQQAPVRPLGGGVLALTEVDVPDSTLRVDQILGGPVLIPVGGPGPVIVVLNDRVGQPILPHRVPPLRPL